MEIGGRKLTILKAIIDDYITTGIPVGSRTISKKPGMELSSATIRNEMSDLEELGFLRATAYIRRQDTLRYSHTGCMWIS